MSKLDTIDLKGKGYATVPTRLKAFREENPRSSVKTTPTISDGIVVFEAVIIKDQSDEFSMTSTGHSYGKMSDDKAFEKLETVSVGRALAMLGYLNSGEIATTEEKEEFEAYQEEKLRIQVDEAVSKINSAESLEALKETFTSLGELMRHSEVVKAKDDRKVVLGEKS